MRIFYFRAFMCAMFLLNGGCTETKLDKMTYEWGDIIATYAKLYDDAIGGSDLLLVKATPFVAYPIGTPLRPGTSSALNDACKIDESHLDELQVLNWPSITGSRQIRIDAGLPSYVKKAINELADAGVKFDISSNMYVEFADQKAFIMSESAIKDALLNNNECMRQFYEKEATIDLVRGYIEAKHKASNVSTKDIDFNVRTLGDDAVLIEYDGAGGWNIEDTDRKRYFVIISSLKVYPTIMKVRTTSDVFLSMPTDATSKDLERKSALREKQEYLKELAAKRNMLPLKPGERWIINGYDVSFEKPS